MKIKTEQVIDVQEWDATVIETYGRPYSLQQQDGCRSRGVLRITVPEETDDTYPDTVPEIVNHAEMCVNFKAWLARDPKKPLADGTDYSLDLWWERNFYPNLQVVANDLHARGLLKKGNYAIDIDW